MGFIVVLVGDGGDGVDAESFCFCLFYLCFDVLEDFLRVVSLSGELFSEVDDAELFLFDDVSLVEVHFFEVLDDFEEGFGEGDVDAGFFLLYSFEEPLEGEDGFSASG